MQSKYLFAVATSLSVSVLLAVFRFFWAESFQYLFLIWNLFLAFIPFAVSTIIGWSKRLQKTTAIFLFLTAFWLLFFPNAPYIITDLFHLKPKQPIPLWYDTFLIFSFAWNGLLLAFLSLADMQQFVYQLFGKWTSRFFAFFVLLASSFGIYIGRFLRWNSWDVVHAPQLIAYETYEDFSKPFFESNAWGVVLVLSLFLWMTYGVFTIVRLEK
ncbi:MAG: DUF1361 domain-containing protein [Bacteroidota bacterium]